MLKASRVWIYILEHADTRPRRAAALDHGYSNSGWHQPGPDRILFHVEQGCAEMRVAERAGVVAALPQVPTSTFVLPVDVSGEAEVRAARVRVLRTGGSQK